jgi:hypothetical protein
VTAVGDAGERIDADEVLEPAIRCLQREAQSRQFFVACFQRLRAFHEAVMEVLVRAFELGFDSAPALQLALQLARAPRDPDMQQRDAHERASDCGAQQGKKRKFDA